MKKVHYVTGNPSKIANAQAFLAQYDIEVEQLTATVNEIQAEHGVDVAIQKARDAYAQTGVALFINDAEWIIPALGGFPGPYMKYVAQWLTLDDFIRLTAPLHDRTIILRDTIVYVDEQGEKVFTNDVKGSILTEPKGEPRGPFVTQLVSLRADGMSLAQDTSIGFSQDEATLWHEFGQWLSRTKSE